MTHVANSELADARAVSINQLSHRPLGPYTVSGWLASVAGCRERAILASSDTCHFPHIFNRDCDFYLNDDCITYSSPSLGHFAVDGKARSIIS